MGSGWLPAFSRKHRVPHDLAHLVNERELGMARGGWGVVNQDPFPWTREDITRATEAL